VKLLLILLIALAAMPAAAGAATWSPPIDVSSPSQAVDNPFIGFGRSGLGLASWRWHDRVGNELRGGIRASTRAASGSFSAERDAPDALVPPVVYGAARVAFLSERAAKGPRGPDHIRVAFGRIDGSLGRAKTIDTVETFRLPAIAANDAGKVAVAYVRSVRGLRRAAKLVTSRRRRFSRPRVVSPRGGVNAVTTAVGPRGDLVVAWERNGRIEARISRPGHGLGRVVRVGAGVRLGTTLRAAVAASGRVWIAWSSQLLTEGGDNGPYTLQVGVKAANRSKFRSARVLDRYDRRAHDEANLDLALDRHGNGFVAWSTFDGSNLRVRLAHASRAGAFVGSQDLSQPGYDAVVGDLATSRSTDAEIVVWSRLDAVGEVGTQVIAGYLQGGDNYAGEELVSRGDRARVPAVAFDPSGVPTVVWSQREGPDGPGVPLASIRTFLRASTRSP
jgi:hypothetical protein